jgi:oligoribonuclease
MVDVNLDRLIWIDLEMTGLNVEKDTIIEIATIVTDAALEIIAEGPSLVIYQVDKILNGMDEWNTTHHTQSGLVDKVRNSKITMKMAEAKTIEFLRAHIKPNVSPMCGNSICQDRRFLSKHMPELEHYFHYRQIDVSTIKELARRWKPDIVIKKEETSEHRALQDVKESINELRHYRNMWLK